MMNKQSDLQYYFIVDMLKVLNAFLMAGMDVNTSSVSGIYPLIIAIWLGSEDTVSLILERGGDVNLMDDYSETPLTTALELDFEEVVNVLLKVKANVNHKGVETSRKIISPNEGILTISYP